MGHHVLGGQCNYNVCCPMADHLLGTYVPTDVWSARMRPLPPNAETRTVATRRKPDAPHTSCLDLRTDESPTEAPRGGSNALAGGLPTSYEGKPTPPLHSKAAAPTEVAILSGGGAVLADAYSEA